MNLPIRSGWIVGLLLETPLIQFGIKFATKLINGPICILVSKQRLVEFTNIVTRKRSLVPYAFGNKFCRILMVLQDLDKILRIAICRGTINQVGKKAVFYKGLRCAAVNIV